jgi:Pyridoxamine 5'-phosphate oxidase
VTRINVTALELLDREVLIAVPYRRSDAPSAPSSNPARGANVPAIPEELAYLLRTNVLAHVSLTASDGSLVTHVMWVDYDGEHILTSSPTASYKSRALRQRPNIAVSVVDPADPWRRISISGRVTNFRDDEGLIFINMLSQRYVGAAYPRPGPREIFVITPDRVRAFVGRR